jgi:UTP-glucose-1-phosphate uridylyltransferase
LPLEKCNIKDIITAIKNDVFGYRFEGTRYDCGSLVGFVAANVAFALERNDMREKILDELQEVYKKSGVK